MYIHVAEDDAGILGNFSDVNLVNSSAERAEDPCLDGIVPIIVTVGLVSSLLSVLVLSKRDMRDMSFTQYLLGNAAASMAYLFCLGVVCLQSAGYGILRYNFAFQVFVWIMHSSSNYATWCAVISGADNCVRLCWPWLIPEYCTTTRSKEVLNALLITVGVSYGVAQWTSPHISLADTNFEEWGGLFSKPKDLLTSVDILMNGVIPMMVALPVTFRLGVQICCNPERNAHHQLRSTIIMLFSVQMIFLLLFLPGCVVRLYLVILKLFSKRNVSSMYTSVAGICQYLYYASFTTNFFIFLSAWRLFRCKLGETFRQHSSEGTKGEFIMLKLEKKSLM